MARWPVQSPLPPTTRAVAVVASALVSIALMEPPAPLSQDAAEDQFSAARARVYQRRVSEAPHPVGTATHAEVRAYIVGELERLGVEVRTEASIAASESVGWFRSASVANVVGRLPGTSPSGRIILAAHYDTVPHSPGANDDGAAVATLLETARALRASGPHKNDVWLLVTDAEEMGLLGARAFARDHPVRTKAPPIVLNFEARGGGGPVAMFRTSRPNADLVDAFANSTTHPTGSSLLAAASRLLPNDTDFTVLERAGHRGFDFAYADGLHHYHSPLDSLAHADMGSLQHHGTYALHLARHFANRDLGETAERSKVYFDVLGLWVIHYDEAWAGPLAVLGIALFVLIVGRGHPRRWLLGTLVFAVAFGLGLTLTGATGWMVMNLSSPWVIWPHAKTLFIGHALLHLGFVCFVVWVARSADPRLDLGLGALGVWVVLSALSAWAPGASYVVQVPLLLASTGMLLGARFPVAKDLALLTVVILLTQALYILIVMDGGLTPLVPMIFVGLGAGLMQALLPPLSTRGLAKMALLASGAGLMVLVVSLTTFRVGPAEPRAVNLDYVYDADRSHAHWVSRHKRLGPWLTQVMGDATRSSTISARVVTNGRVLFASPAPKLPLPPPVVHVQKVESEGSRHRVELGLGSARGGACLRLWVEEASEVRVVGQTIDGQGFPPHHRFSREIDARLLRLIGRVTGPIDWKLIHCGFASEPRLTLEVEGAGALVLRAVDLSYGFPPALGVPPRPPHLMADSAGDRVMVTRQIAIPLPHRDERPRQVPPSE